VQKLNKKMNYLQQSIDNWNARKELLKEIGAPKSVPYGDWTFYKNEIMLEAVKLYELEKIKKQYGITDLFSKKKIWNR
jgi:hypothetical protein